MKFFNQLFFIALLASCNVSSGFLFFNRSSSNGAVDCCAPSCNSNPLECGDYDIQFQVGVCPIRWNNADHERINSFTPFAPSSSLILFRHAHFSSFYQVPWIIGAQAGYSWSDHVRVYVEVNYVQARAKQDVPFFTDSTPSLPAAITMSKYKLFDAYMGGRYYSDRCWCNRVSYFLGGKIGLVRHRDVEFDLVIGSPVIVNQTVLLDVPVFDRKTSISGGINGGFDICCGNWSLVITGEIIISKGSQLADDVLLSPPVSNIFTNVFFGKIGSELRFPVTAGIRYTF